MIKNYIDKYIIAAIIICLFTFPTGCIEERSENPVDYVNPFIGTSATGHTFPGASRPFGMVQLGPDNGETGDKHYNYSNKTIIGFSHTHLSGTGTGTLAKYANILFMPSTGPLKIIPGTQDSPDEGYCSRYSHDEEYASPGYYRVNLIDYDIEVEFTATKRAGMHCYLFPKTGQGYIIIDITRKPLNGRQDIAGIEIIGDRTVAGSTTVLEREGDIPFTWYFYAELSRPFNSFGTFSEGNPVEGRRTAEGKEGVGAYLSYGTDEEEVILVRVGISFTGIEGAKRNLREEISGWNFDGLRKEASADWNANLSRVQVGGSTRINKVKFYTSLYHCLMFPCLAIPVVCSS